MKPTLASRRARVVRIQASRPADVEITVRSTPSADPELLRRFGHWLDRVLLETGTPDKAR